MFRRSLLVLLTACLAALYVAACSSASATAAPDPSTDAGDAAPSPTTWSTSACGACVTPACTGPRQVCDAEPSCAAHAKCADACPASANGALDAACLAACPGGANTVASRARAALDACLTDTGTKSCAGCPKPVENMSSTAAVLNQKCPATSTDTTMCGHCEDVTCCDTYAACEAVPECKQGLAPCLKACNARSGGASCSSQCYAAHPLGVAAWAARETCLLVRCATECGAAPDACLECTVRTSCRDQNARCHADADCFLLTACIENTCAVVTDACITQCKAKSTPAAAALYDAWFSCSAAACKMQCS